METTQPTGTQLAVQDKIHGLTNNQVGALLTYDIDNALGITDLFSFATTNRNDSIIKIDKEEEILDCSELFTIDKIIQNNFASAFCYSYETNFEDAKNNAIPFVKIKRARRKVFIELDLTFVELDLPIYKNDTNLISFLISKYAGDNKFIFEVHEDNSITVKFIKQYRNEDGVVINNDLVCLCIVEITNSKKDFDILINNLKESDLFRNSDDYEYDLKSAYMSRYQHLFLDYFNEIDNQNKDTQKFGIELKYAINKELNNCEYVIDNALKLQHFRSMFNSAIDMTTYSKVINFIVDEVMEDSRWGIFKNKDLHSVGLLNSQLEGKISAAIFFMFNIDKNLLGMMKEANVNKDISTRETLEDMVKAAIDSAFIISKDIVASVIDGEELSYPKNPRIARILLSELLDINGWLARFRENIIGPVCNEIITDILERKAEANKADEDIEPQDQTGSQEQ